MQLETDMQYHETQYPKTGLAIFLSILILIGIADSGPSWQEQHLSEQGVWMTTEERERVLIFFSKNENIREGFGEELGYMILDNWMGMTRGAWVFYRDSGAYAYFELDELSLYMNGWASL